MGGAAEGKLYQFSGFYNTAVDATVECDAYDPVSNIWTRIADIPQAISHSGQVFDANTHTFWLAGGFLGNYQAAPSTTEVWKYNVKNNTWTAGPPLPAQRGGGALVKLRSELHYFGGSTRVNGVYLNDYGTHWALDLNGGKAWRTTTSSGQILAPMPNPRNHLGGIVLNGKIYAIGGQHLGDQNLSEQSEVDVYDPTTNTWTLAAPMPRPIGHIMADVFVRGGRIDIASGVTLHSVKLANVTEYDPLKNTWSELPPLPAAREAPVSGLVGNQIVVTCGALPIPLSHNQTWVALLAGSLPRPWVDQDVGAVGARGSASSSGYSSFLVAGSGIGIGSNADSFHYVYQPLNGDGQIVVKVATQENTNSSAAAGVMIRENTDPSSKHASMLITPSNGVFFQRRLATGGATSQTVLAGAGITAPYWVKLVRSGDTLTGYRSSTGTSWSQLGSDTISMGVNVLIGVAVSSSASTVSSTSTFTDLDMGPESASGGTE
jgi:N-acetylneuraminic acid mutarotase